MLKICRLNNTLGNLHEPHTRLKGMPKNGLIILEAIHEYSFEGEGAKPVLLAGVAAAAVRGRGSGQRSDVAVG